MRRLAGLRAPSGVSGITGPVDREGQVRAVVRIRLFAPFDRLCGRKNVVEEFSDTPTLADVLKRLVAEHPALEGYLLKRAGGCAVDFENYFLACVGERIVLPDDALPDGAEVALFAPHAGG
jgi:molybdopterin converting factor small subunit